MQAMVLGVLRHMLTTFGGSLVASGALGANDLQAAVGAIVTLLGVAWSLWDKRSGK